ncbi:hypothetical protein B0J11DRAFT_92674 [Dendryphion nanum]|uniref:Uncharacterized protein n=1 Tax=Dendryphion nanum TaxID=256645 RepID=A0A9P9IDM3_9PLEO|nr:hypothetical protein B0J11DRAFT_92674 [Dendryphion nanum]
MSRSPSSTLLTPSTLDPRPLLVSSRVFLGILPFLLFFLEPFPAANFHPSPLPPPPRPCNAAGPQAVWLLLSPALLRPLPVSEAAVPFARSLFCARPPPSPPPPPPPSPLLWSVVPFQLPAWHISPASTAAPQHRSEPHRRTLTAQVPAPPSAISHQPQPRAPVR